MPSALGSPASTRHVRAVVRIAFNICVGNTDDHLRNLAAFRDGQALTITPAYDVCPQSRAGQEAQQALAIRPDGWRCGQLTVIHADWDAATDEARLTAQERDTLWGTQIMNPYITDDWRSGS